MQSDDSSCSDDGGWPDLMQSDLDELSRIRARSFMQHMLLTTAFFGLVGTAALVGKMTREVWKIDRCSDLFYDMENSWPKYSLHLQDKLYIKHFTVDFTTFRYIYNEVKVSLHLLHAVHFCIPGSLTPAWQCSMKLRRWRCKEIGCHEALPGKRQHRQLYS